MMKIATMPFVRTSNEPVYKQIYKHFIRDMYAGYLCKNDKLPSIREAMQMFNVSKTSVENAYEKLLVDGYVRSISHIGYFVDVDASDLVRREQILQKEVDAKEDIKYNLTSDAIDMYSFDAILWKRYMKEAMEDKKSLATYGDVQGELELRRAIQTYAYSQRGVLCEVEQIIVGASYQSLLYLLCSLFQEKQKIAMEEDSFMQAQQVFMDMQYPLYHLKRQEDGIDVAQLEDSEATLFYVQSSACGKYRTQLHRQKDALLAWCDENHYIIEDDHNGELRYEEKVLPALQGFKSERNIVYLGSFSKILLPSLRIAYMVLPKTLLSAYQQKRDNYSPSASKMEQLALANYIAQGNLDRHIKRVRKQYERKNKVMKQLLEKHFPHCFYYLEETSFQYVIEFKAGLLNNIDRCLKQEGIAIKRKENTLYVSFSSLQEEDMEYAILKIKAYLEKESKHE